MAKMGKNVEESFESIYQQNPNDLDPEEEIKGNDSDDGMDEVCEEISSLRKGVLAPVIIEVNSNFSQIEAATYRFGHLSPFKPPTATRRSS